MGGKRVLVRARGTRRRRHCRPDGGWTLGRTGGLQVCCGCNREVLMSCKLGRLLRRREQSESFA
jgi:hypothetical protein